MVNVIFNDFSYELAPKKKEMFDKYCGIIRWGRRHPTRFIERFLGINLTDMQKMVLLNSWTPSVCVWLMSRNSGKSFLTSPFIMSKALLFPNHRTYILSITGSQAQMTFTKLEDLAKGNIASVLGTTSVFLDECVKANPKADSFTHEKNAYHVELYNGSEITSLSGVAKNIVGVRSSLNVYDEAGESICPYPLNCWDILRAQNTTTQLVKVIVKV